MTHGGPSAPRGGAQQEVQLETKHLALLVLLLVLLCLGSFQVGRWVERRSLGPAVSAGEGASGAAVEDMGDVSEELTFFDTLQDEGRVPLERPNSLPPARESRAAAAPPRSSSRSVNEGVMVQVFASKDRAAAQAMRQRLREKGYTALLLSGDGTYKVRVGPYADREEAELQAAILRERENLKTWIP